MTTTPTRRRTRLAAIGAGVLMAVIPAAAHAAVLNVDYDAQGTAHIASTNSTINLLPTTLSTSVDFPSGPFTGSMPLPGTTTKFSVAGFIPVTANVNFVEAAPVTGVIGPMPGGSAVTGTASYHIRLSNIKVVGFPAFAGPSCRTKNPVSIPIANPSTKPFNLFTGGELTGEFSIGDFQNCGLNTWLINQLIPGGGNTVDIQISNGRRVL
jgi:hypothetical protein